MKHLLSLILISFLACSVSYAQGIVRGKVTESTGEPAVGAIVSIKGLPSTAVQVDIDGNYSIKITDSTAAQTLLVTTMGYPPIEAIVKPKKGEIIIKNFVFSTVVATELKIATVVAKKKNQATDQHVQNLRMNSSQSIDVISANTVKKIGDANVMSVVTRVPGVSSNSSGFITVRGIGDRYIKTSFNDARIPTLDPFTNNIKLDMFPASLINNVILTKTASPDLPGDWAGAYISVQTKDYPDKLMVNVESTVGYNYQTSFRNIVSSQHSTTDWLGYDNNFRDIDHKKYVAPNISPSNYDEMNVLLGDYFKSLGVSRNSWNTTFFNLGLVQLGLLQNCQMDDPTAIQKATEAYNNSYKLQAFDKLNEKAIQFAQSLPNNWSTTRRKVNPNFSQSFTIGNQADFLGGIFGFLGGFRYSNNVQYDSLADASIYQMDDKKQSVDPYTLVLTSMKATTETNSWSALLHLAYKFPKNHRISVLFMPNFNGTNSIRMGVSEKPHLQDEPLQYFQTQFYEERKQLIYQVKTDHYIPALRLKIDFNASYTNAVSNVPDFKKLDYNYDVTAKQYLALGSGSMARFFRNLTEDLLDSKLSAEFPIGNRPGIVRKIKFGAAYQQLERGFQQRDYLVYNGAYAPPFNSDLSKNFDLSYFNIRETVVGGQTLHTLDSYYRSNLRIWDNTVGSSTTQAAFIMADYGFIPRLRVTGGVRAEKAFVGADIFLFDSLGYKAEDPRRGSAKLAAFNSYNLLPSISAIFKIRNTENTPINLRTSFSETVARPSIRELTPVDMYDYQLRTIVGGNKDLQPVKIQNYDLRLEAYFESGDNLSISFFHKDFQHHIELVKSGLGYFWQNTDKAYAQGIEIEGKKTLWKNLEFRANITLVNSQSTVTLLLQERNESTGDLVVQQNYGQATRNMFGQAPYVVNSMLIYTDDSLGLTATVSYNLQGPKLALPGMNLDPDVYEVPRHLLDAKISKTLGKHFSVSLNVRDMLNAPIKRSYRVNGKWMGDFDQFRYGTNYVLGISYKL